MTVTFETKAYGKIECTQAPDKMNGSDIGEAYFFKDDYISTIDSNGEFTDQWGRKFRIHWPKSYMKSNEAILEVQTMSRIGTARPEKA